MKMYFKILIPFLVFSCHKIDGVEMAKEVCECVEVGNQMEKGSTRSNHLDKCWDMMDDYEISLEENPVEKDRFDQYFPCIDTIY